MSPAAAPAPGTFSSLPILSLADASSPSPSRRKVLAGELRKACLEVGFFYIKDHGVPPDVIQGAFEQAERFFALPLDEKEKIDIALSSSFRGYTGLYKERVDTSQPQGDLHEGFNLGLESGQTMGGENVWPDSQGEGFREPVMRYYDAIVSLGKRLFPLFALALDLDETFFDHKTNEGAAIMRLLHYPPAPPPSSSQSESLGIGAHTDYECFTILAQDTVPALQVRNALGEWIDAPPIPGTFVVNIGDQLSRWTNDLFLSTPHRASNLTGQRRYSIPVFYGTNYDVPLKTIPTCITPERPEKYEVVSAGNYVQGRLRETYL